MAMNMLWFAPMEEMSEPLIVTENLRKSYGDTEVLRGIDFSMKEGEIVAVMGRSGSGKTTFLNVLGGLDCRFKGKVMIDGLLLRDLPDVRLASFRSETIGFVFQNFQLLPHLNVLENIALPAFFTDFGQDPTSRALELLEAVGLPEFADSHPAVLSAGQKQRVAIARALFNGPKLLLCDEPTGNLDSATAGDTVSLFRRINDEEGVSILIVTHDTIAARAADRVLEMKDGLLEEVTGD